ncbi:unnamed protein product [Amoebophrya sp. A25]|nr:unnamed protein product [Amoebophrya sp. A25]|eukprot:GSA25T00012228001.1
MASSSGAKRSRHELSASEEEALVTGEVAQPDQSEQLPPYSSGNASIQDPDEGAPGPSGHNPRLTDANIVGGIMSPTFNNAAHPQFGAPPSQRPTLLPPGLTPSPVQPVPPGLPPQLPSNEIGGTSGANQNTDPRRSHGQDLPSRFDHAIAQELIRSRGQLAQGVVHLGSQNEQLNAEQLRQASLLHSVDSVLQQGEENFQRFTSAANHNFQHNINQVNGRIEMNGQTLAGLQKQVVEMQSNQQRQEELATRFSQNAQEVQILRGQIDNLTQLIGNLQIGAVGGKGPQNDNGAQFRAFAVDNNGRPQPIPAVHFNIGTGNHSGQGTPTVDGYHNTRAPPPTPGSRWFYDYGFGGNGKGNGGPPQPPVCVVCSVAGHVAANCPTLRQDQHGGNHVVRCFHCGAIGHTAAHCPLRPQQTCNHGSGTQGGQNSHFFEGIPQPGFYRANILGDHLPIRNTVRQNDDGAVRKKLWDFQHIDFESKYMEDTQGLRAPANLVRKMKDKLPERNPPRREHYKSVVEFLSALENYLLECLATPSGTATDAYLFPWEAEQSIIEQILFDHDKDSTNKWRNVLTDPVKKKLRVIGFDLVERGTLTFKNLRHRLFECFGDDFIINRTEREAYLNFRRLPGESEAEVIRRFCEVALKAGPDYNPFPAHKGARDRVWQDFKRCVHPPLSEQLIRAVLTDPLYRHVNQGIVHFGHLLEYLSITEQAEQTAKSSRGNMTSAGAVSEQVAFVGQAEAEGGASSSHGEEAFAARANPKSSTAYDPSRPGGRWDQRQGQNNNSTSRPRGNIVKRTRMSCWTCGGDHKKQDCVFPEKVCRKCFSDKHFESECDVAPKDQAAQRMKNLEFAKLQVKDKVGVILDLLPEAEKGQVILTVVGNDEKERVFVLDDGSRDHICFERVYCVEAEPTSEPSSATEPEQVAKVLEDTSSSSASSSSKADKDSIDKNGVSVDRRGNWCPAQNCISWANIKCGKCNTCWCPRHVGDHTCEVVRVNAEQSQSFLQEAL